VPTKPDNVVFCFLGARTTASAPTISLGIVQYINISDKQVHCSYFSETSALVVHSGGFI
ncbi:hypothetical protein B0I73DRAFT_89797, partial [Yarrowia lipolytica]